MKCLLHAMNENLKEGMVAPQQQEGAAHAWERRHAVKEGDTARVCCSQKQHSSTHVHTHKTKLSWYAHMQWLHTQGREKRRVGGQVLGQQRWLPHWAGATHGRMFERRERV